MFYITISNGLLKNGHRKRMGAAVWEFMWLIDKVTRVDTSGYGYVLGGKPIKLEEIADDLEVHRDTISENLKLLEKEGYIEKKLAPYGIIIKVIKAKKRFGKSTEPNRIGENTEPQRENTEPGTEKTPNVIKTIQLDNNNKTQQSSIRGVNYEKLIAELIYNFKDVHPSYKTFFNRKPQREAIKRMLIDFGEEKLRQIIAYLPKHNSLDYVPVITTPVELENKMGALMASVAKQKSKQNIIGIAI